MPGLVSPTGLMRRELGLSTRCVRSVLDPPRVEASTILGSVQNPCCLVKPVLDCCDKKEINEKMKQFSDINNNPGLDYRTLHRDLLQFCKAGWGVVPKFDAFVKRSTVVLGIKIRASNIYPNDPTYEERQRKELDRILEENIQRLFYSIWRIENSF
jgi:hypothetical protein